MTLLAAEEVSLSKDQMQLAKIRQGFFKVTENVKPLDSELGFSPKPPMPGEGRRVGGRNSERIREWENGIGKDRRNFREWVR